MASEAINEMTCSMMKTEQLDARHCMCVVNVKHMLSCGNEVTAVNKEPNTTYRTGLNIMFQDRMRMTG